MDLTTKKEKKRKEKHDSGDLKFSIKPKPNINKITPLIQSLKMSQKKNKKFSLNNFAKPIASTSKIIYDHSKNVPYNTDCMDLKTKNKHDKKKNKKQNKKKDSRNYDSKVSDESISRKSQKIKDRKQEVFSADFKNLMFPNEPIASDQSAVPCASKQKRDIQENIPKINDYIDNQNSSTEYDAEIIKTAEALLCLKHSQPIKIPVTLQFTSPPTIVIQEKSNETLPGNIASHLLPQLSIIQLKDQIPPLIQLGTDNTVFISPSNEPTSSNQTQQTDQSPAKENKASYSIICLNFITKKN